MPVTTSSLGSLRLLNAQLLSLLLLLGAGLGYSLPTYAKKAPIRVVVSTIYIDVFSGPGRGSPVFHVLEKGETITLLKRKTDWIKIETDKGIKGWVRRRDMVGTEGANGELVELGIPDRDDFSQRHWEFGFTSGEFDGIPSLGVNAGWRFTKNLSAELRFSQATGNFSYSQIATVGLSHQAFPEWRFSPFFTLAVGSITTERRAREVQREDNSDEIYLAGIGGYYYFTHRFLIRAEYNQYTSLPTLDENFNLNEWRLGLSAFF